MNVNWPFFRLPRKRRVTGMFNLNDPRWGRGDQPNGDESPRPHRPQPQNDGPMDLDELWNDLVQKIKNLMGGGNDQGGRPGAQPPREPKSAGIGLGLIGGVLVLVWLGTGFFIVQEGQQAVITQFGKYHSTVGAGFNWRMPYPVQGHETVSVTQIRSLDVGRDSIVPATGLRDSAMLTQDENIVEVRFAVQYRLSDARAYLFSSRDPEAAVLQAAETAVREVVGKMKMDAALAEERDQLAPRIRALMQTILDRYNLGIEVVGINLQQGGVRPPEQVQAAFDDVLKAGQERERAKNEAEAYANDVVPRARGTASRMQQEAEGYKARVVSQAQGDAQRFKLVQAEYAKAPQVTRDRMYLETMQTVYSNVTKVLVDSRQNGSMLYLPLDKILQGNGATPPTTSALPASQSAVANPALPLNTERSRDSSRSRDSR